MSERLEKLKHELKRLTKNEKIHRLCTRVGMLEKFLRNSTPLTNDGVMELLTFLLSWQSYSSKIRVSGSLPSCLLLLSTL